MNKAKFNSLTKDLENPTLVQRSVKSDYLNCHFIITGKHPSGLMKLVVLPGAKQTGTEKRLNQTDTYHAREKKFKLKYERWLHCFFGNYCTSELSIKGLKNG